MTSALSARALHSRLGTAAPTISRVFLAISLPSSAIAALTAATEPYLSEIEKSIPDKNWHITIAFLGEVKNIDQHLPEITADLSQEYVSVASVTHLGQGKKRDQLWAYVYKTPALEHIRVGIVDRLHRLDIALAKKDRVFIPHINLAQLKKSSRVFDAPLSLTFPVRSIDIFRSTPTEKAPRYDRLGSIILTP